MKNNNGGKKFNKNSKKPMRPKNEIFDFTIAQPYTGNKGREVSNAQVEGAFEHLQMNKIFDILSVPVQIAKSVMFSDPDRKGFINVGYIKEIPDTYDMISVCVYGNYVEKIDDISQDTGVIIKPRIITDREGDFVTFTAFDLVIPEPYKETTEAEEE